MKFPNVILTQSKKYENYRHCSLGFTDKLFVKQGEVAIWSGKMKRKATSSPMPEEEEER